MTRQHVDRAAIVAAVRTPIGSFGGSLKDIGAAQLGSVVVREALDRCGFDGERIDEVILGNVLQAGTGPNPARLAAVTAGVPYSVPSVTINKVCGSGLKAIALAAQAIECGSANAIVAGGMENMSNAPYLVLGSRWGTRMGHERLVDSMIQDALWDCFYDCHMGSTAENLAQQYGISRTEQDRFALRSQMKYAAADASHLFDSEIVPVSVPQGKAPPIPLARDEHPRPDASLDGLAKLKPAFKEDGTVTAANSSGINDGAAAVLVVGGEVAARSGLTPLAYIRAAVSVGVDPKVMGIGPAVAVSKLLRETGTSMDAVDLFEVNEAFAAQTLAVGSQLGWHEDRVNVNGGAIALGHPIGASGARIVVTLVHEMQRRQAELGIAALCIGGGMGIAMLLERP